MDRKTLEYMAVRVAKSKSLIERIEKLKRNIELNEKEVCEILFRYNGSSFEISKKYQPELFEILKNNFTESAANEIARLEKELDDL